MNRRTGLLGAFLFFNGGMSAFATPATLMPLESTSLEGLPAKAALHAFKESCRHLWPAGSWRYRVRGETITVRSAELAALCPAARASGTDDAQAARFFSAHFTAYAVTTPRGQRAAFTGYFMPEIKASRMKTETYRYPIYGPPTEIVHATAAHPLPTRQAIEDGALAGRGLEILWTDDPVARFFLQVQGSGYVRLPDGSRHRLRYAGKNQQPYVAIGQVLVKRGDLPRQGLSMQAIRDWLHAHPDRQREVMATNPSYVFFTLEHAAAPVRGSSGATLTGLASLAIDPATHPYGLPFLVRYREPCGTPHCQRSRTEVERLMIAQDRGSAIKGPARADLYFGGEEGAEMAGYLDPASDPSQRLAALIPNTALRRSAGGQ